MCKAILQSKCAIMAIVKKQLRLIFIHVNCLHCIPSMLLIYTQCKYWIQRSCRQITDRLAVWPTWAQFYVFLNSMQRFLPTGRTPFHATPTPRTYRSATPCGSGKIRKRQISSLNCKQQPKPSKREQSSYGFAYNGRHNPRAYYLHVVCEQGTMPDERDHTPRGLSDHEWYHPEGSENRPVLPTKIYIF